MKATIINVVALRNLFLQQIKNDKKKLKLKNISVYYEIMNPDNCMLMGVPYMSTFNAYDGSDRYNYEKRMREAQGYIYSKPVDVVVGGVNMKRIIISGPAGKNYNEHFGTISGYVQAANEVVCYMVRY